MARKIVIENLQACRYGKFRLKRVYGETVELTEENLALLPADLIPEVAVHVPHLLSERQYAEYLAKADHRPHSGHPCEGCVVNLRLFMEIYNREEENVERLPELRERPQPPEPQAV